MYFKSTATLEAPAGQPDDAFYLYFRTAPVVLIYGTGQRLHADEHNHSGRLLRELDKLGREGIELRGLIRGNQTLTHSSLRALNCFLHHSPGLAAFKRIHPHQSPKHKYAWEDFQRLLNLRWA